MGIDRDPFTPTRLEEDREDQEVISVKLNATERRWLNALKKYYRTPYDSTALKNKAFEIYKQMEELSKELRK